MLLALLTLLCLPQASDTRFENHPGGELRAQFEVRVEPDGSEVRHGAFTSWYPDGQVESEGSYADGAREGEWTLRWPNGKRKAVGDFKSGQRDGVWRHYDERGKRVASGPYEAGSRNGKWTFWDEKGKVDQRRSGIYRWQRIELEWVRLPEGFELSDDLSPSERHRRLEEAEIVTPTGFAWEGESRDGAKSGLWVLRRADGSPAFVGHYAGGPSGPWVFIHADGTVDREWLSGRYMIGVRAGALEDWPEGFEPPPQDGQPDPRRAAPPPASEASLAAVDAWIAAEPGSRESAMRPLLADRQEAFEAAVARLQTLDLTTPEGDAVGRRLNDELLRELVGVAYAWQPLAEPDATRANALSVLRWRALRELTDPSDRSWVRLLDPAWRWIEPDLQWTPLATGPVPPRFRDGGLVLGSPGRFGARFAPASGPEAADGRGTAEAVDQALDWLVRTQDPDGGWEKGTPRNVEATGFALLALLGAGELPTQGARSEAVARGLEWLVHHVWPSGQIATGVAADLRSHALALQSVAEATYLSRLPALLEATRRARDFLLEEQLPDGSWPRDRGGTQGDTLTTAYAWFALHTVQETRVRCEAEPRERALTWLDEHTGADGATEPCDEGRVPVTTAWSALCRLFAGRDPVADPQLSSQVGWLIAHPSSIQLGDPLLDSEYVCLGAYVLFQVGGQPWTNWNSTMREQLLQVQHRDGDLAGSWDPSDVGPRDRTSVTALRALTFEVYSRFGRVHSPR